MKDWSNQSSYNTDDKEQGAYLQCHEVARCQLDLKGPYSWAAGNAAVREGSKGFCTPARGLWSMQVPHSSPCTCSKAWLCPTCSHPGKPAVLDLSEPAYSRRQQLHETSSKAHSSWGFALMSSGLVKPCHFSISAACVSCSQAPEPTQVGAHCRHSSSCCPPALPKLCKVVAR